MWVPEASLSARITEERAETRCWSPITIAIPAVCWNAIPDHLISDLRLQNMPPAAIHSSNAILSGRVANVPMKPPYLGKAHRSISKVEMFTSGLKSVLDLHRGLRRKKIRIVVGIEGVKTQKEARFYIHDWGAPQCSSMPQKGFFSCSWESVNKKVSIHIDFAPICAASETHDWIKKDHIRATVWMWESNVEQDAGLLDRHQCLAPPIMQRSLLITHFPTFHTIYFSVLKYRYRLQQDP